MITDDLDPVIQRAFDTSLADVRHLPQRRAAVRRARPVTNWVLGAVGAASVLVAAVVVGSVLGQYRADLTSRASQGFANGKCSPTPITLRTDVGPASAPAFATPVRLVIGGNFAGHPQESLRVGDYWYLRDPQRRPSITLRAHRLDATEDDVIFKATGFPLGPGFPAEWSPANWYYRTAVDALDVLPRAGCWRVSVEGGALDDAVVYDLADPRR